MRKRANNSQTEGSLDSGSSVAESLVAGKQTSGQGTSVQQNSEERILIVDDELSICSTLEAALRDEGYFASSVGSAEEAIAALEKLNPSLVLLDIWMPGMDGIEALQEIRRIRKDLPIIVISGHATIETAIRATRLGASDFIEKPLDLDLMLESIRAALGASKCYDSKSVGSSVSKDSSVKVEILTTKGTASVTPIVFSKQAAKGREFPQRTLKNSAILYGQGLHTGRKSGLILEPLPVNSGIHFGKVSDPIAVPAHLDFVESTGYATTVKLGNAQAGTIEHIMSALHAYGVSNLLIKCNGEVPVMDGSALEFCSLIEEVGLEEQGGGWFEIVIDKTLRVGNGEEFIQIEPSDEFEIEYTLKYPAPVGEQKRNFILSSPEAYKSELASARTFGFVKDIGWLQQQGLALGGRFDNFVLFGEEGVINTALRFDDEPVRHKILDAIGDLFLLGRRLRGKVTASMTGHSDNVELLRKIQAASL